MAATVRVWLDGEEQRGVVSFDTRDGTLQRYVADDRPGFKWKRNSHGLVTETVTGKVEAVGAVG
jgi:hypothetical protein